MAEKLMTRDGLLLALTTYTTCIHEALERETDSANRAHYVGYLAMAARIFMYLHLQAPSNALHHISRIQNVAHGQRLPGQTAATTRQAWQAFSAQLESYLQQES